MNDLIQVIKVLNEQDLKIINDHIDTLTFKPNTVFGTGGELKVNSYWRTSTGTFLNNDDDVTCIFHQKINDALVKYKEREQYGNTKLNPQKVREIRKLAKEKGEDGKTSNSDLIMELALELEVEYPTIRNVILKKSWKHID